MKEAEMEIIKHTENFISQSHPGLPKDWLLTALASGNIRAEETEDN